jgi:hypothetical protein
LKGGGDGVVGRDVLDAWVGGERGEGGSGDAGDETVDEAEFADGAERLPPPGARARAGRGAPGRAEGESSSWMMTSMVSLGSRSARSGASFPV